MRSAPPLKVSLNAGMTDTTSKGSNRSFTSSTTSEQWDTILSGDFAQFCIKVFNDRDDESAIEIDETNTKIEVLDINDIETQAKYGPFLKSAEYEIWSRFNDLNDWYRTHEFDYDEGALFEIFMRGELPVAVQSKPSSDSASDDSEVAFTQCKEEWNCSKFEKYLIDTSGDSEFPKKFGHKDHEIYPFLKDTAITKHLNSGALEGMPRIDTRYIQVDMQGYDYNIQQMYDENEIGTMTASKLISTGTVERIVSELDKKNNPTILGLNTSALLTNIYVIRTTIQNSQDVLTSIRYGTPVRKQATYLHQSQRHKDLIKFAQQIRPRKTPDQPNRVCVLTFLEHCDHNVSFGLEQAVKKKGHEDEILRVEMDVMHNKNNVYVQQMSASAGLTFRVSRGTETMSFHDVLALWSEGVDTAESLLRHVHEKHDCFDSHFDPKLRFMEFIAISMIQFILQMDSTFNFILCYHCMSGKDRTGMFFAINETVHHFCAGLKKGLEEGKVAQTCNASAKPKSLRTSIFRKHSSKGPVNQEKAWMQLFDDLCKLKPSWFENDVGGEYLGQVLDKFVRRSILITGASTGWFGLKFGIGLQYDFKNKSLITGLKKQVGYYLGANPVATLLAPHSRIMDWQLDSQQADS